MNATVSRVLHWSKQHPATIVLWAIYFCLLGVLLPHTAWAFRQFEPDSSAWAAGFGAVAFEAAIAALTWGVSRLIQDTPEGLDRWERLQHQYANAFGAGLLIALAISVLANWAHAEEFSSTLAVFTERSVPPLLYTAAFGAILPVMSFVFAHVLADAGGAYSDDAALTETEQRLEESERARRELRQLLDTTRQELAATKQRVSSLEEQLSAAGTAVSTLNGHGKLFVELVSDDGKARVLAANQLWPGLPQRSLAVIAGVSAGYVSQVLAGGE